MVSSISTSKVEEILRKACDIGKQKLRSNLIRYSSDSDDNERVCLQLLKESASQCEVDPDLIKLNGGAAFPDVSIQGATCGIELKGTKKGAVFTGNSIYSASHIEGINKIFLLYWIADEQEFGYRDYFACVFDVKVTHKPRYKLDINLRLEERLFGVGQNQIGSAEEIVFNPEGVKTEVILDELRRRAIEAGEVPWWLPRSEDENEGGDAGISLASLKYLGDLDRKQSFAVQKSLFLGFPEVLAGGRKAHYNAIGWCISRQSVIVNRDPFSAGGKSNISVPGLSPKPFQVSGVINKFLRAVSRDCPVSFCALSEIYKSDLRSIEDLRVKIKKKLIAERILDKHVSELLLKLGLNISQSEATEIFAEWLLDQINKTGFIE